MALYGFADTPDPTTTLNGAINNSQTSLVVTSAALFPAVALWVPLLINETEIVLCTSRSGTTCTIVRAQGGTAAVSHANGVEVTIVPTAAAIQSLRPVYKVKAGDESVTSSTTLQNDNDLIFAVNVGEVWSVEYVLFYEGATGGDFKIGFTLPLSAAGFFGGIGIGLGPTVSEGDGKFAATAIGGTISYGGIGAGVQALLIVKAHITIAGTAGNVTLQWAQETSSGTATILKARSHLLAQLVA